MQRQPARVPAESFLDVLQGMVYAAVPVVVALLGIGFQLLGHSPERELRARGITVSEPRWRNGELQADLVVDVSALPLADVPRVQVSARVHGAPVRGAGPVVAFASGSPSKPGRYRATVTWTPSREPIESALDWDGAEIDLEMRYPTEDRAYANVPSPGFRTAHWTISVPAPPTPLVDVVFCGVLADDDVLTVDGLMIADRIGSYVMEFRLDPRLGGEAHPPLPPSVLNITRGKVSRDCELSMLGKGFPPLSRVAPAEPVSLKLGRAWRFRAEWRGWRSETAPKNIVVVVRQDQAGAPLRTFNYPFSS